jgi:hypothetical protein
MSAGAMSGESAFSEDGVRFKSMREPIKVSTSRVSILTDTTLGVEFNEFLLGTPSNYS